MNTISTENSGKVCGFFVSVSQQSQWHGEVNNGYG